MTQFFAPNNGGDTVFPRKEKVRRWDSNIKTLVGIGGGTFAYRTWTRGVSASPSMKRAQTALTSWSGPPSELGRLIQADREAKELQRAAKNKLNLERRELEKLEKLDVISMSGGEWSRPPFVSNASYDSTTTGPAGLASSTPADDGQNGGIVTATADGASEAGDADSLIGSLVDEPLGSRTPEKAAKTKRAPKSTKAKQPRKSKLAQEIGPDEPMEVEA